MTRRTIIAGLVLSVLLAVLVHAADESTQDKAPSAEKATSVLVLPAKADDIIRPEYFVNKWLLLGPFTFSYEDFGGKEQTASIDHKFVPDEESLDGTQKPKVDKNIKWKPIDAEDAVLPGLIDLGTEERVAIYAVAWIDCPEAIADATLLAGSDDYLKVWINGKLLWTYNKDGRGCEADQDKVEHVSLKKGMNRIVAKVINGLGDYEFCLRFADKDGNPYTMKPAAPAK